MNKSEILRERKPAPKHRGPGRPPKYPWRELKPNSDDSFFVVAGNRKTVSSCATLAGQRMGRGCLFTCRTEENGIRVWRVS
jgi:hypothetical protein